MDKVINDKKQIKRVKTYIQGLDEQMEGGVPQSHVVLVCGVSGTMKSSLCFNILYNEVMGGKNALYVSLEQSSTSLLNHLVNMEFDLKKVNLVVLSDISKINEELAKIKSGKGVLVMTDMGAIRKEIKATKIGPSGDWLNVIKNVIKKMKQKPGCDLFVLDSLTALYVLTSFEHPRTELFYLFEFLRDLGITTFLVSEMPLDRNRYGNFEIEDFLADGVIKLDLVQRQRKVTREISVVKMRGTDCNIDVFSLEFEGGNFKALYGGKPALI